MEGARTLKGSTLMPRGPAPLGLTQWVQGARVFVSFLGGDNVQPAVRTTTHYVRVARTTRAAYATIPELRSSTSKYYLYFMAVQIEVQRHLSEARSSRPDRDSRMSDSEDLGPNHF